MSTAAVEYVRDVRGISVTDKCVLFVLATYASERGDSISPSTQTIADDAGCSRSTACEALRRLQEVGKVRREGMRGQQVCYSLPDLYDGRPVAAHFGARS